MRAPSLFLAFAALALSFATAVHAEPVRAVASFNILADVVQNVGGADVVVTTLVPPNGDPHEFEPSPKDAGALRAADVTFLSGNGLEPWFARLARAAGTRDAPVVVSAGIRTLTLTDGGRTELDPHVWNSIPNVLIWVDHIEAALVRVAPQHRAAFEANAAHYRAQLEALDARIRTRIAALPADARRVLTGHDAFGYFEQAYGVHFLAPQGVSTETEPSAARIAGLIDQIRREHVRVYFIENSSSAKLVEQIAQATGARPGGTLYPESLSPPDGPAPTYLALMEHNASALIAAIKAASEPARTDAGPAPGTSRTHP